MDHLTKIGIIIPLLFLSLASHASPGNEKADGYSTTGKKIEKVESDKWGTTSSPPSQGSVKGGDGFMHPEAWHPDPCILVECPEMKN